MGSGAGAGNAERSRQYDTRPHNLHPLNPTGPKIPDDHP